MSDINIRTSDPRNYQLPGSVSLWFRRQGSSDAADWKDLGHVINPALSAVLEQLEHFSHRRGQRAKDRVVTSERSATLNFSIDEINLDNLQFAFGSEATPEAALIEVNDNKVVTNPGGGETIDLGVEDLVPDSVIIRSVNIDEDSVTYSNPTDFTFDENTGIVTIDGAGALADADEETGVPEIHIFYRKEVGSQKFEIFPGTEVTGQARLQILTEEGLKFIAEFGNVTIKNNGDITIGDGTAWQEIPLSMSILVDTNGSLGMLHAIGDDEL